MSASDRPGQAAAAIEALGESPSPSDARRDLAEFDAKDLAAALVSRGGGGGAQTLQVTTAHLSAAQILDIANTPVVVVPAPAADEINWPLFVFWRYTFGGQGYDYAAALALAWEPNLGNTFSANAADLTAATDNYSFVTGSNSGGGSDVGGDQVGTAVVVCDPLAEFVPPLGDGTLDVTVYYFTIALV